MHIHKQAGRGRSYSIVIEGVNGTIVTAMKNLSPKELGNLADTRKELRFRIAMVIQHNTIHILIGETAVTFIFKRSVELGESADLIISLVASDMSIQSKPTILSLADVHRLGAYIESAMKDDASYEYVPMNLGFELIA